MPENHSILFDCTKQAIIDSTLALAQKKPLHRITVREIVEDCDITRNTFYYHFRDVYDVLTCYFEMEFDRILEQSEHDTGQHRGLHGALHPAQGGMAEFLQID